MCMLSCFSHVQLFAILSIVAYKNVCGSLQARILEWVAIPPGDLPNPGIEPVSLMSPELAGGFFITITT